VPGLPRGILGFVPLGSLVGAVGGGYLAAAWAPTDALLITLAAILAVSTIKIWTKSVDNNSN
jgi:hypothetical protein